MTYLVERLARLRTHLAHLRAIMPKVTSSRDLDQDQSLGACWASPPARDPRASLTGPLLYRPQKHVLVPYVYSAQAS